MTFSPVRSLWTFKCDPSLYACTCDMTRRKNPQATPPCLACSLDKAARSLGLLEGEAKP